MDSVRRNRQIDSLKYLIRKCEEHSNTTGSSIDSNQTLQLNGTKYDQSSSSMANGEIHSMPVEDKLLKDLNTLSELQSRLHDSTLLADSCLMNESDKQLPSNTFMNELLTSLEQLGSQLSWTGEHLETVSWRLLQTKFTSGLDIPYEQHKTVKSILEKMAHMSSNLNEIEQTFQKAAAYKPSHRLSSYLKKAMQVLLELRASLESIQTLRLSFTTGGLAPQISSSSLTSEGTDSVVQSQNGSFIA